MNVLAMRGQSNKEDSYPGQSIFSKILSDNDQQMSRENLVVDGIHKEKIDDNPVKALMKKDSGSGRGNFNILQKSDSRASNPYLGTDNVTAFLD